MNTKPIILSCALLAVMFCATATATTYSIVNLTQNISGEARYPSLNDKGQVAYQVIFDGNDIDLFLDGTNLTPGTYNVFNGIPSLNNNGSIAWMRWYSSNSPYSGYDVILDGVNLTATTNDHVWGPSLNDSGQVAWSQHTNEWDIFLDGVNLTDNLNGSALSPSLNDNGQVAWIQSYSHRYIYLDGIKISGNIGDTAGLSLNNNGQIAWVQATAPSQYDIFLDGVNLTAHTLDYVEGPSLNDKGQVAWWQFDGRNYDIYVDGYNLTAGFSFFPYRSASHPSINNRGQIAWAMNGDIYLATPVNEPETLVLMIFPLIGLAFSKRWKIKMV